MRNKINTIHPNFVGKLDLKVQYTNINTQKIDNFKLNIFNIIITSFLVENKNGKFQFFEKIFLLANFSMIIILVILFFILSKIEVNFVN